MAYKYMKTFRDVIDLSFRKDRRKLYTGYMLRLMGSLGTIITASSLGPASTWKILARYVKATKREKIKLGIALRRLERRKLVQSQKRDDGNEYMVLTQAGEAAFLKEKKRILAIEQPSRWDSLWRILIFDIKEDKKRVRDAMRRHLKRLGFWRLQKSVFVIPYPCRDEMQFLKEFYEAETEICLITASSLGEKEIAARKHFRLPVP